MNSVFAVAREFEKKQIERIKELKERAEQLKEQTQEEIKSQGERDMLQVYLVSLDEEVEMTKKTSNRLSERARRLVGGTRKDSQLTPEQNKLIAAKYWRLTRIDSKKGAQ